MSQNTSAASLDPLYLSRINQLQDEGFTVDESSGIAGYEKALNVMQVMYDERLAEIAKTIVKLYLVN